MSDKGNRWVNHKYNFDNLGQALMSLFVLSSKDGWVSIMYQGLDAVGPDLQVNPITFTDIRDLQVNPTTFTDLRDLQVNPTTLTDIPDLQVNPTTLTDSANRICK
jgi:hypothetical protein